MRVTAHAYGLKQCELRHTRALNNASYSTRLWPQTMRYGILEPQTMRVTAHAYGLKQCELQHTPMALNNASYSILEP